MNIHPMNVTAMPKDSSGGIPARKASWTKQDLLDFKGTPETGRLEFKSSLLLQDLKEKKDKIAAEITKEVSAFANSEGGIIVVGIKEKKEGKTRIAEDLDEGVEVSEIPREQFQQLVEGNLRPYLPGIRFFSVPLSDPPAERVAFVIDVPQGITAYQASDNRYYGRSEYEAKALPDHEIRLRMNRGRCAQLQLEAHGCQLVESAAHKSESWAESRNKLSEKYESGSLSPEQHDFVRDFLAEDAGSKAWTDDYQFNCDYGTPARLQ